MKENAEHVELAVPPERAGLRLDRFLAEQLPELSRTRIQSLVDEGRVRVDGISRKPSHRVESGEKVFLEIPAPPPPGVEPEAIPLEILYEDEALAIVNKPAGMVVHPGAGLSHGTLVAALLARFGSGGLSTVGGPLRPGIVHRLDKDTSGALIVARTDVAHKKLVEGFSERRIEKTYVALLHGNVKSDSGRIELPVARDLRRRTRMTARRREGREARTDWLVRLRARAFTLVQAGLHTGRTHQIRVHFSAIGCPVVGDTLYGAPRAERIGQEMLPPLGRNFLHAARIAFDHPITEKHLDITAALPQALVEYLQLVGRAVGVDAGLIDAALQPFL